MLVEVVGFTLKRWLGASLMPLPVGLMLLVAGLLCWWRGRSVGRWLSLGGLLVLLLASWPPLAERLLAPLEDRYSPLQQPVPGLGYVVVMGGSHAERPGLPAVNRLNTASTYRLLEGVAIHLRNPGSRLVLMGGGGRFERHAEVMSEVAQHLGVAEAAILLEPRPRDTRQEGILLAALLDARLDGKETPVVVVTSAAHMHRTLYWLRQAGVEAIPAPTDFQARRNSPAGYLPSVEALAMSHAAWHEYLGLLWGRLTQGRDSP